MHTIGPPSMAGRYIPKQNAATDDSGTKAPTASPGCSPIASMVERPAYRIAASDCTTHLGRPVEPEVIATAAPPAQRSTSLTGPPRGGEGPAVEGVTPGREGIARHRPALEHVGRSDHRVGPDVLHRELELGRNGVAAEHRDHAASQTDGHRGRQGPPRVVRLHQHGRRATEGARRERGEVARSLHDLADGVRAERVHDRHLAGRAFGPLGELLGKNLHVSS